MATPRQVRRRGRFSLLIGTVVAALLLATVAFADNVRNDVVASGNGTITAGGSTTINYYIQATGQGNLCDAADGSAATLTINVPADVTVDTNSSVVGNQNTILFTSCDTNKPAVFSSSKAGSYAITVSVADSAGSYNATPANFTLTVNAPTDNTAPNISCGSPDGNWHATDVTISCTASDSGTGLANSSDASFSLSTNVAAGTETNNAATGSRQVCDKNNNCATAGPITGNMVDKKAPSISDDGTSQIATGNDGTRAWYKHDVTVDFSASDGGSGLANSCPSPWTKQTSGEGVGVTASSGACSDAVGNTNNGITSSGYNVDKTKPTLSPSVSPNPVLLNGSATASANAGDALSGLDSSRCDGVDTSSVGSQSVTCYATDNAGNSAQQSVNYDVNYRFVGFSSPVDNNGVLNKAKAGQAIPFKWQLLDANNVPVTTLASVSGTAKALACAIGSSTDLVEEYAAGASGLQNLGGGHYQWNWKSPSAYASSCKTFQLNIGEAAPRTALFQFTK